MPSKHGGQRANQTGRPRLAARKVRVGTLFLIPNAVKALTDRTHNNESLIQAAARLLTALVVPDPEVSDSE